MCYEKQSFRVTRGYLERGPHCAALVRGYQPGIFQATHFTAEPDLPSPFCVRQTSLRFFRPNSLCAITSCSRRLGVPLGSLGCLLTSAPRVHTVASSYCWP